MTRFKFYQYPASHCAELTTITVPCLDSTPTALLRLPDSHWPPDFQGQHLCSHYSTNTRKLRKKHLHVFFLPYFTTLSVTSYFSILLWLRTVRKFRTDTDNRLCRRDLPTKRSKKSWQLIQKQAGSIALTIQHCLCIKWTPLKSLNHRGKVSRVIYGPWGFASEKWHTPIQMPTGLALLVITQLKAEINTVTSFNDFHLYHKHLCITCILNGTKHEPLYRNTL